MKKILIALVFTTFTACGPGITVTLDKRTVPRGGTLTVTLHNGGLEQIGYNLCGGVLTMVNDPQVSGKSTVIACPAVLQLLGGWQSDSFTFDVADTAPKGTYQYSTRIDLDGTEVAIGSADVTIE